MLKKLVLAELIGTVATTAMAEEEVRTGQLGVASYATILSTDYAEDDEFSGFAIFGSGAFNDNVALRGLVGFQSHDQVSDLDVRAFEGSLLAGTGLATVGFKAYGSAGFFTEKWEYNGYEESFNGFQLGGGFGYNWNPVSLELWINFREASDYEDLTGVDVSAVSGGLGLSARF